MVLITSAYVLVISTYYLLLPLEGKLELFCVLDEAHLAEEEPVWHRGYWSVQYTDWVDGYWTCPRCGSSLTRTVIWEAIDAGMGVYYCEAENIFWVGQALGPLKGSAFYGPYQGYLWKLTNAINPLALVGIILSAIALLCTPVQRLLTKTCAARIKA